MGRAQSQDCQLLLSVAAEGSVTWKPRHTPISKLQKWPRHLAGAVKVWLLCTCWTSIWVSGKNPFNLKKSFYIQWGRVTIWQTSTSMTAQEEKCSGLPVHPAVSTEQFACHVHFWWTHSKTLSAMTGESLSLITATTVPMFWLGWLQNVGKIRAKKLSFPFGVRNSDVSHIDLLTVWPELTQADLRQVELDWLECGNWGHMWGVCKSPYSGQSLKWWSVTDLLMSVPLGNTLPLSVHWT